MRSLKDQIYQRIKQPLMTLISSPSHEIRYTVLKHVEIIVPRCPGVFDDQFKRFYCDYNEPVHLKFVKLRILPNLTNEDNVHELVNELSEYVNDIEQEISKRAIIAFGQIAVKLPGGADGIINQLLEFISMDVEYVRVQVVKVIKDLLRKFPGRAADVMPALPRCLRHMEDPEGKSAVIFMLSEFGAHMRVTPYLFEPIVDAYEDETSVEVKMALLVAVTKLFFQRAPEVHAMLTQLLTVMLNDFSDSDLHDRALLFYRLLKYDLEEAKRCLMSPKETMIRFNEERHSGLKQRLFEEFNTLSVLYEKPAEQFIEDKYLESGFVGGVAFTPADDLPPSISLPADSSNFYDDSDLLGFTQSNSSPWSLKPDVAIDQETYQSYWEGLEVSASLDIPLSSCPSSEQVERLVKESYIFCMASGDLGTQLKFYFFGRDETDVLYLAEVQIDKRSCELTAAVKSDDAANAQTFADSLMASLGSLL